MEWENGVNTKLLHSGITLMFGRKVRIGIYFYFFLPLISGAKYYLSANRETLATFPCKSEKKEKRNDRNENMQTR